MIVFYRAASGESPVEGFLDRLGSAAARKVTWVLRLVGTDGIWECRADHGSDTFRILCFMASGNRLVLTHGFAK